MQEIAKNIIKWTKLKIRLHLSNKENNTYFKAREVWWASLGANIGFEEDGKHDNFERPVLILKKFNRHILWALPLTSQDKQGYFYYQFSYNNKKYSIILSQLRLISSKRLLRKIRMFEVSDFEKARKHLKSLI